MGLVRIVIQEPEGKPSVGLDVTLRRSEPETSPVGQGTTDEEGVVRFWAEPGTYGVHLYRLPDGIHPPKYGTTVRLEDFAEGIEQVVRLVRVG